MSALERLKGYREVASHNRHKPVAVVTPDLAVPDKVYATEILHSEGVLHAVSGALKKYLHRHPSHHVDLNITSMRSAIGDEVSPVAEIHLASDDPDHPLVTFRSRVNIVWDTLKGVDPRKGVARVYHSIHDRNNSEDASGDVRVWQDLMLPPDRPDMSLEERIRLALHRANGLTDEEFLDIKSADVAERPSIELE